MYIAMASDPTGSWHPCNSFTRGVVLGTYEAHVLDTSRLVTLQLGDLVYAFEVHSSQQWVRAFAICMPTARHVLGQYIPMPNCEATRGLGGNGTLLHLKAVCVIIPRSLLLFAFGERQQALDIDLMSGNKNSALHDSKLNRKLPPVTHDWNKVCLTSWHRPIICSISIAIHNWLFGHAYRTFLSQDYDTTLSLIQGAIAELLQIRDTILYNFCTSVELSRLSRRAVWLMTKFDKILDCSVQVWDPETGFMLCPDCAGPDTIAKEQLLYALAPEYPQFDCTIGPLAEPKQLLMSVESFTSSDVLDSQYAVYFYLATKYRRISESFKVLLYDSCNTIDLPMAWYDEYNEALINPGSHYHSDKLYLVAEVFQDTFTPRKRVALGVSIVTGHFRMSLPFRTVQTIRLYAPSKDSFFNVTPQDIITGQIDKIVPSQNPREITVTLQDFHDDRVQTVRRLMSLSPGMDPLCKVSALFDGPNKANKSSFYVLLDVLQTAPKFCTPSSFYVECHSPRKCLSFSEACNEPASHTWQSACVYSGGSISQLVKLEDFGQHDYLEFKLYDSHHQRLVGSAKAHLFRKGQIVQGAQELDFTDSQSSKIVAALALHTFYIGRRFECDLVVKFFESYVLDKYSKELLRLNLKEMLEKSGFWYDCHFELIFEKLLQILIDYSHETFALEIFCTIMTVLRMVTKIHEHQIDERIQKVTLRFSNLPNIALQILILWNEYLTGRIELPEYIIPLDFGGTNLAQFLAAVIQSGTRDEHWSVLVRKLQEQCIIAFENVVRSPQISLDENIKYQISLMSSLAKCCVKFGDDVSLESIKPYFLKFLCVSNTEDSELDTEKLKLLEEISVTWIDCHAGDYMELITLICSISRDFCIKLVQSDLVNDLYIPQLSILCKILTHQMRYAPLAKESSLTLVSNLLVPCSAVYILLYKHVESNLRRHSNSPRLYFKVLFSDREDELRPIDSAAATQNFDEKLIELGIVVSQLCSLAQNVGTSWLYDLPQNRLSELVNVILECCLTNYENIAFPFYWRSLAAHHRKTILKCVRYTQDILTDRFTGDSLDASLWSLHLRCVLYLGHLEGRAARVIYSQAKICEIHEVCSDPQDEIADLLIQLCPKLGCDYESSDFSAEACDVPKVYEFCCIQTQFPEESYSLLKALVTVIHSAENARLLKVSIQMLASLVAKEVTSFSAPFPMPASYNVLEQNWLKQLCHTLIAIVQDVQNRHDVSGDNIDRVQMRTCFDDVTGSMDSTFPVSRATKYIMDFVMNFIDLNIDFFSVVLSESHGHLMFFHSVNCFRLLRSVDYDSEKCAAYISRILEYSQASDDNIRTGLAYSMLASLYNWSSERDFTRIDTVPNVRGSTPFEIKEELYRRMIRHFVDGNALEYAVDATKELMKGLEQVSDYSKLSDAANMLTRIYLAIDNRGRLCNTYFHVAYLGNGFSRMLENKAFIVEGTPFDTFETIKVEYSTLFPTATIVNHVQSIKEDSQYVSITTVDPVLASASKTSGWELSSSGAQTYVDRLNLNRFRSYRVVNSQVVRDKIMPSYVKVSTFKTKSRFPTILGQSEIVEVNEDCISLPVAFAEQLERKSYQLEYMNSLFQDGKADEQALDKLAACLADAIHHPVEGGVESIRILMRANMAQCVRATSSILQEEDAMMAAYGCLLDTIHRSMTIFHENTSTKNQSRNYKELVNLFNSTHMGESILNNEPRKKVKNGHQATPLSNTAAQGRNWFKTKTK